MIIRQLENVNKYCKNLIKSRIKPFSFLTLQKIETNNNLIIYHNETFENYNDFCADWLHVGADRLFINE